MHTVLFCCEAQSRIVRLLNVMNGFMTNLELYPTWRGILTMVAGVLLGSERTGPEFFTVDANQPFQRRYF